MKEELPISKLKLLEKNPRTITKEQMEKLCNSLQNDPEFLQKRPILINKTIKTKEGKNGTRQIPYYEVYCGNQRVRAAKQLKWKTIFCDVDENLSEETMKERTVKDNLTMGDWDWDLLANEYDHDKLFEWGFTEGKLSFDPEAEIEAKEEEETEQLKPPKDPITKLGDIYELIIGDLKHVIGCGDSCDPDFVSLVLGKEEPILMVTDPPYGVNYDASWREVLGQCQAKGKVKNDDQFNWSLAWHLFPGSVGYVWCASWYLPEVAKSLDDNDFKRKSLIIWVKQHFAISRGDYHWQHEPCWYVVKKGHKHNWQGSRKESTVWEISNMSSFGGDKSDDRTAHSTQKPIECMARPIRNNTAPGESIYDPFIGSGTTLIAAEMLARNCYGIEIYPAYCDIIIERWVNYMHKNKKSFTIKKNGETIEWQEGRNQK